MICYTTQNSSDNIPSYPPDNHHSFDTVYWREGQIVLVKVYVLLSSGMGLLIIFRISLQRFGGSWFTVGL